MNKIFFSDIPNEQTWAIPDMATVFAIPKKWWSIRSWILINQFLRNKQIFFMVAE